MTIEQRRVAAYPYELPTLLCFGDASRRVKVNALRELQVKSESDLLALMPFVLDKAFKGEL